MPVSNGAHSSKGIACRRLSESLAKALQACRAVTTRDEQIKDLIVIGITDIDVSQKLKLKPDLTLKKAISIAHQSEFK